MNAGGACGAYCRDVIFHIATRSDWETARDAGEYRISTLGRTLEEEGFIHCSENRAQVLNVARSFYIDVDEPLLLLALDESKLDDVRHEPASGSAERFPHVYGPIPLDAVITVAPLERVHDDFVWPPAF